MTWKCASWWATLKLEFLTFFRYGFRYCERKFVDERVLVMHQKARHFKCDMCMKKLGSAIGLAVHQHQMHNKQLKGYVFSF